MFILLSICVGKTGLSQDESVINYTTKDGLPSSQVYDIIQDDYGYLWFSTDKGLSRYDGYEFQNFNKSNGLPDNVVFDLVKQENGQIWGTTNSASLFYFEGANPKFTPYKFNKLIEERGANKIVHSIYLSENEDIYIGYHKFLDYLKISKSGKLLSVPRRYDTLSLSDSLLAVHCIVDDGSDPFYFVKRSLNWVNDKLSGGIQIVSSKVYKSKSHIYSEAMYFENEATGIFIYNDTIHLSKKEAHLTIDESKKIIASGKLNDHQFWIGYLGGGVSVYDLSGKKINEFLTDMSVTQLFVDHEGHSWISTLERGVFMIRNKSMNFLSDLGTQHITSLSKGPNNDLFIGTYDGDIYKYKASGEMSAFFSVESHQGQSAYIAYDESKGQVYFSSALVFDQNRTLYAATYATYISLVGDKHIALGSFGVKLLNIHSKEDKELFGSIRTKDVVFYDGAVYAAGVLGLYRSNIDDDRYASEHVVKNIRIDDLEIFNKYLVLGTNGDGLIILDKLYKPVFKIRQNDGLTSNFITKSYSENDSTLWICTNKGINRVVFNFKKDNFKIEKLDVSGGLASNEVWDLLINNDTIWIGTQSGVNFMSKKDFASLNMQSNAYFLQWKSMRVNDNLFREVHSFEYDQNKLEFWLQGISFAEGSDLIYQYKLLGLDENWSFSKNRKITYSSLPAGSYELIVQIKGENTPSHKNEIRYAFIIHPPFWKTAWFFIVCVLVVGAVVYLFFKIRVLTYNKDVVREIMRYILQKLRRDEPTILLRENGKDIKVKTGEIHYIKTSGNYLEVHLCEKSFLIRSSISKFMESLPDKIEFIQVHRSYIVRIDKVEQKGKDELVVLDTPIPIGRTYSEELKLIEL